MTGHDLFMRHESLGGDYQEPMVFEAVRDFALETGTTFQELGDHGRFPICFAIRVPPTP